MMRGDLHTLKRVCEYASVVMLIGEAVFAILLAALLVLGIGSFFSSDMSNVLNGIIYVESSDPDLVKICSFLTAVVILIMAFITVKMVHDTMESLKKEYTPFVAENTDRMKVISLTFLVSSVVLLVLLILSQRAAVFILFAFFGCLLVSVVMYCVTIVCRYGMLLQKESDETL